VHFFYWCREFGTDKARNEQYKVDQIYLGKFETWRYLRMEKSVEPTV